MRTLPLAARFYLIIVCLSAIAIAAALIPITGVLIAQPLLAGSCLLAMILAEYAQVSLEVRDSHRVNLTVGEAVAIFTISVFGPAGALLILFAAGFDSLRRRRSWERVAFNASMLMLVYVFAAQVYGLFQQPATVPFSGPAGLLALVGVAGTYYGANGLLLCLMVALATGQPVLRLYRELLQQVNWPHLLTFTLGATMAALYAIDRWLLLYGVVILVVARSIFATVAALNRETRQHQELAEERVRLYEELQRQQAELTRASKLAALGTLSAGIAHEFNNVLTAILGHAQLGELADGFAEKNYSLSVISRVCQRATSITSSLLTFARQREPELSPNRLQDAISETLELVRPDLERDKIRLVTAVDDLPSIMCDLGQINQVLLNLITNARDALRERADAEIRLCLRADADQAVLTIADNGPGIPPEVLDKIFQPFITTKKKGNGLGMAICYGIIESHRGHIHIDSSPDQGTTIAITLPMGYPEPDDADEQAPALARVA